MKGFQVIFSILFVAISVCLILYSTKWPFLYKKAINNKDLSNIANKSKISNTNKQTDLINRKHYSLNKIFLINNNLAQFSSYLIIDEESINTNIYKIEVFIHLNYKYIADFGPKENFKCLVKIEGNTYKQVEIIELDIIDAPKLFWKNNKKFECNLNIENSLVYKQNKENFDLNNIFIALIYTKDFDKNLSVENFSNKMRQSYQILPYSLIKYQTPDKLRSVEPRLKSISLCAHYIYKVPSNILTWFNMNFSFKINEIMIYDGTLNGALKKFLIDNYGEDKRITIVPFKITFNEFCNETLLFEQYSESDLPLNLRIYLKESCKIFFLQEFSEPIHWRWYFEQLTANDCFAILSRKHEFIGRYDTDEFIFPRSFNSFKNFNVKKTSNNIEDFNSICSSTPFYFNNNTQSSCDYCFYDYIISIVKMNLNGRDLTKLSSIRFNNVLYMSPNFYEKLFISSIGNLIEKLNETTKFPLHLYLTDTDGYSFIVEQDDLDYINYLFKTYNRFISNIYETFIKNISSVDRFLLRYMYISIGSKEIHFYKNVKSIYHHYHLATANDSWNFNVSLFDGHFMGHFRNDPSWLYKGKLSGSIRNVNFDFEHIFYLLQKFTTFCDNLKSTRF
jgi:hypothetical protein